MIKMTKKAVIVSVLFGAVVNAFAVSAADAALLVVPLNRSVLVESREKMTQVAIADPNIADAVTHGDSKLSVLGKKLGKTTIRIFGDGYKVLREYDVEVTFDLPIIRRTIGGFFPDEKIGVEVINNKLALTGIVSSAEVASKAVEIVSQYVEDDKGAGAQGATQVATAGGRQEKVVNLLQVRSNQQVMLRVKMGEIQRTALRNLGTNMEAGVIRNKSRFDIGGKKDMNIIENGLDGNPNTSPTRSADFSTIAGAIIAGSFYLQASLEALETKGLFKTLAEPNLVAMSGEKAEFLAGGEFPIPIAQPNSGGTGTSITIQFKQYGIAVQFTPYVLAENRIKLLVQPEVSELSDAGSIKVDNITIPALTSRRAKTTVELAPGESLMIAGLLRDSLRSSVQDIPGLNELPIIGSILRSTNFDRTETELVITVTPYLVDPAVASDLKLPTDNFKPASVLEGFFYGALSSMAGDQVNKSQRPTMEGAIGFMTE